MQSHTVVATIRLAGELGRGESKGKAMRSTHFIASCAVACCLSIASTTMAQATGACCVDLSHDRGSGDSFCVLVTEAQCAGFQVNFDYRGVGSDCTVCFGGGGGGACCFGDMGDECVGVPDESACQDLQIFPVTGRFYQGDGTSCIPNQPAFFNACPPIPPPPPPDMPAVSQWGVATLVLLILAGITIKFSAMRRRA